MPSDGPPRPRLRPYQQALQDKTLQALHKHRSVVMQLPTGGGKSVIIASIARLAADHDRRACVVVHRRELVEQMVDHLKRVGLRPGIVGEPTHNPDIYVAMVQTLSRRTPPPCSLIVIDEAHHATAASYRRVIETLPDAKVIGVTATPQRLGGQGLDGVFDELVTGPSVSELIDDGYLAPPVYYACPPMDMSGVARTAGDYNKAQLATLMEKTVIRGDLISTYKTHVDGKKAIVFAASVDLAKSYAEDYNNAGIPAAYLDGNTPARDRAIIVDRFRQGSIQVLTNCMLFTEGFDVPDVDVVQMVRPTESLTLYLQMVGRAMRPHANKQHAIILDHVGNYQRHGLPADDRDWTLTGRKRRGKQKGVVDIDIGLAVERARAAYDHDTNARLIPIDSVVAEARIRAQEEARQAADPLPADLRRLISIVEANNYTNSRGKTDYYWAYKRWVEAGNKPTTEQLRAFAKVAGYHHMWVKHQTNQRRAG